MMHRTQIQNHKHIIDSVETKRLNDAPFSNRCRRRLENANDAQRDEKLLLCAKRTQDARSTLKPDSFNIQNEEDDPFIEFAAFKYELHVIAFYLADYAGFKL